MRILCAALLVPILALASCSESSGSVTGPGPVDEPAPGPGTLPGPFEPNSSSPPPSADPHPEHPAAPGGHPADHPTGQQNPPEPIPEPGTFLLFGLGLTGLAVYRRRRRPACPSQNPAA